MNIDELEGAELDALVAEKVMGYSKVDRETSVYNTERWSWLTPTGQKWLYWQWNPSDGFHGGQVMLAMDKALADGWTTSLWRLEERKCCASVVSANTGAYEESAAATLPLAICRALVKAYSDD